MYRQKHMKYMNVRIANFTSGYIEMTSLPFIHYTQSRYFLLYGIACICHWNAGVRVRLYAKLRTQYTLCDPVSQADPVENFVLRVICSTLTMPVTSHTDNVHAQYMYE